MILGTAGHIDHGKTALVKALTGVDTDRLPEEKKRGITIELGFAPLALDGATLGVVDVPGHEAFVRTMLAGATGVDLALLVIAADEGPMPQTREHLAILSLLGIGGGVVAISKCDLVEPDWLALVTDDVRTLLAGTPLEAAPIIPCSAVTGVGLDAVRAALSAAARNVPARASDDLPRLPVDRAFSVRGAGTVVTGTLWSGTFARDDAVRLCPSGLTARIRSIESHGVPVDRALPGSRTAIALAGLDRDEVERGGMLVRDGDPWHEATVLRADVALLDGAPSLGPRTRVRFHLGTSDVGARLVVAGGRLESGRIAAARLVLDAPVVARAGDRFVLRVDSPVLTIGGGIVTDPHPPGPRARPFAEVGATLAQRSAWIVRECGGAGLALADAPVRLGVLPANAGELVNRKIGALRIGERLYDETLRDRLRARLLAEVSACHARDPIAAGLTLERARTVLATGEPLFDDIVRELAAKSKLTVQGNFLARTGFTPASSERDAQRLDDLAAALAAGALEPPSVNELASRFGADVLALLRLLEKQKRAVAVAPDRFYAPSAVARMLELVRGGVAPDSSMTASQLREILGLSRKFVIPFLEYCDRVGHSDRRGDLRVFRAPHPIPPGGSSRPEDRVR